MNSKINKMRRGIVAGLLVSVASTAMPAIGWSEEVHKWRAVALHRNGEGIKKWDWLQEQLPARTNGKITLEVVTAQEMGLSGTEVSRLLRSGVFHIAEATTTYIAGDFPMIEATELPGVVRSYENGREIVQAWSDNVVKSAIDQVGGQVIGNFAWSSGFLYTKFPVESLDDLKGKKIRVFSPSLAAYVEALGAEPISMPVSEVYGALQRGLMDGVLTGTDQINAMKMWEIAPHLTDVRLAPTSGYVIVSQKHWDALSDELKTVVTELGKEMTELGWKLGADNDEIGMKAARDNNMTIKVPAPAEWNDQFVKVANESIVPWWTGRVGGDSAEKYKQFIGPVSGVSQ